MAKRFEELKIWEDARQLAVAIYDLGRTAPLKHDFGMRDQLNRAAVSIMSNIAEGFERYSRKEFNHFLSIARGSSAEVRSLLTLAHDLGYLKPERYEQLHQHAERLSKSIGAFHTRLKTTEPR